MGAPKSALEDEQEAIQFLRDLDIRLPEPDVREIVIALQRGDSLYRVYAGENGVGSLCAKATAKRIKGLLDTGKLVPYLTFIRSQPPRKGGTSADGRDSQDGEVALGKPSLHSVLVRRTLAGLAFRAPTIYELRTDKAPQQLFPVALKAIPKWLANRLTNGLITPEGIQALVRASLRHASRDNSFAGYRKRYLAVWQEAQSEIRKLNDTIERRWNETKEKIEAGPPKDDDLWRSVIEQAKRMLSGMQELTYEYHPDIALFAEPNSFDLLCGERRVLRVHTRRSVTEESFCNLGNVSGQDVERKANVAFQLHRDLAVSAARSGVLELLETSPGKIGEWAALCTQRLAVLSLSELLPGECNLCRRPDSAVVGTIKSRGAGGKGC